MAGCGAKGGVESWGESEAEAESESEGEATPCAIDCAESELCLYDAVAREYACVPTDECRDEKRCGEFCCPTGSECRRSDLTCPLPNVYPDESRLEVSFETRDFAAGACELSPDEGPCVGGSGERRLLRFTLFTRSNGEGDFYLGRPADEAALFTQSSCHGHYHFESFARYALLDEAGDVAAAGGLRAPCVIDLVPIDSSRPPRFGCALDGSVEQGIQRGWADEIRGDRPCQWIDVTGVPPGGYRLRVELNYERVVAESDYNDNVVEMPVSLGG